MSGDWFYLSFADGARPAGEQFLGGCYVQPTGDPGIEAQLMLTAVRKRQDGSTLDEGELACVSAVARAHQLGINPGGEVMILGPLDSALMDERVPASDRDRLLTAEEVNRAA